MITIPERMTYSALTPQLMSQIRDMFCRDTKIAYHIRTIQRIRTRLLMILTDTNGPRFDRNSQQFLKKVWDLTGFPKVGPPRLLHT
jgi:hypothetical protein